MELNIPLKGGKKLYFASDFHLGWPDDQRSRERELKVIRWLDMVAVDAAHIFLVGDVFDFWYEYRHVVPKGFVRFLGKLAELSDKGVGISLFGGNHDMWMKDYLSSEIGVKVYPSTIKVKAGDCSILVGHGDGLGPGDYAYKVIKVIFTNPVCRKLFSALHPWFGVGLAHFWSRTRKNNHVKSLEKAKSQPFVFRPEKEILLSYCQKVESKEHHDFHVFGHRHLAIDIKINDRSRYINLGHWLSDNSTFGVFDGKHFEIKGYECKTAPKVYPVT